MKKIITCVLLLLSPALSALEFADVFDMSARGFEREANIILTYQVSEIQFDRVRYETDMQFVTDSLASKETKFANSPVFRFVQGLHARNMVVLRQHNDQQQKQWRKIKQDYFAQAMALDKTNEPHLSAAAYADMKKGLDGDLKQQAIAAELKLGGNGENESYYWYLHWSNINELQKQGKIEEAEAALKQMREALKAEGKSAEIYQQIAAKARQDIEAKKNSLRTGSDANSTPQPVKRDHTTYTEENVQYEYYLYLLIVIVVMLVMAVGYFILTRKRSNR